MQFLLLLFDFLITPNSSFPPYISFEYTTRLLCPVCPTLLRATAQQLHLVCKTLMRAPVPKGTWWRPAQMKVGHNMLCIISIYKIKPQCFKVFLRFDFFLENCLTWMMHVSGVLQQVCEVNMRRMSHLRIFKPWQTALSDLIKVIM